MNHFKEIVNNISNSPTDLHTVCSFNNSSLVVFNFRTHLFSFQEFSPKKYAVTIKLKKGDITFSTEQNDMELNDFILLKKVLLNN